MTASCDTSGPCEYVLECRRMVYISERRHRHCSEVRYVAGSSMRCVSFGKVSAAVRPKCSMSSLEGRQSRHSEGAKPEERSDSSSEE